MLRGDGPALLELRLDFGIGQAVVEAVPPQPLMPERDMGKLMRQYRTAGGRGGLELAVAEADAIADGEGARAHRASVARGPAVVVDPDMRQRGAETRFE